MRRFVQRFFTLCVLSTAASSAVWAQVYIKSDSGCLIHNALPQANERVTWSGACVEGYAQGKGIVRWYLGERINEVVEANFVKGKMDGECRIDHMTFGSFVGTCKDDRMNGFGTMTYRDGRTFSGMFENGRPIQK